MTEYHKVSLSVKTARILQTVCKQIILYLNVEKHFTGKYCDQ